MPALTLPIDRDTLRSTEGVQRPSSKETGAVSFTARGAEPPPLAWRGEGSALSASRSELGVAIGTGRFGAERGQTLALSGSQ